MSWDCCNPKGECNGGHGCPAGVVLHQSTERKPLQDVARLGKQHPRPNALRRVQLDAGQAKPARSLITMRRVLQLVGAAAVLAIWMLANAAADHDTHCSSLQGECTTWETQA